MDFFQFYIGTASVSCGVVPMEYSTSVMEAITKVIVTKTVIIISHLAARVKSGSCGIARSILPGLSSSKKIMREAVFAFAKIQPHLHCLHTLVCMHKCVVHTCVYTCQDIIIVIIILCSCMHAHALSFSLLTMILMS